MKDVAIALLAGSVILLALAGCYKPVLYPGMGTADDPIERIYPSDRRTVVCTRWGGDVVVCR